MGISFKLKSSLGYTLTEMTAVVATAGVLTAVMLPVAVSQVQQARMTAAAEEIATIGGAIPKFLSDTGDFPMRSGQGQTFEERYAKIVLFSTDENGNKVEPACLSTLTSTPLTDDNTDTFRVHFFCRQGEVFITEIPLPVYINCRGPYLTEEQLDPWGNSYVVYLEGVAEAAHPIDADHDGTTDKKILILSAGPNGCIETSGTATSPGGDDIIAVFG